MRALRALPMLILLFAAGGLGAHAEEEAGIRCDLHALVDADDAGLLSIYDGLRKGLELAQLPRVCRDEPDESGVAGFVERRAAHAAPRREAGLAVEPFFAVGDRSCGAVAATGTDLPWVGALVRYTAERTPLQPLPQPRRGAIVYAHLSLEQVGETLRAALGEGARSVRLATSVDEPLRAAWTKATGLAVEPSAAGVAAVVDLRLDPAAAAPSFEEALAEARRLGVPFISDDRVRFGQGAVIVLVARHDLLGRAAADEARTLREEPERAQRPRIVPGFEVWVDLAAAEALGVELPLPFLARVDRLKRGRPGPRAGERAPR